MNRINLAVLVTVCLLVGWIAGSGGQVVGAQEPIETVFETEVPERDCRFEIPEEARLDGRPVLLDQCTGDTWRFDDGYDFGSSSYVRDYSWVAIGRD